MGRGKFKLEPFQPAENDPFTAEHEAISKWVKDAVAALGRHDWYRDLALKSQPSGLAVLEAEPEQARRLTIAAVRQLRHWDREASRVRSQGKNEMERLNAHLRPGWDDVWSRRRHVAVVITALTRRALPFQEEDLLEVLDWCNTADRLDMWAAPIGNITRAVQRFTEAHPISSGLRDALQTFGKRLRDSHDKGAKRYGTIVEQLCSIEDAAAGAPVEDCAPPARPVHPAPAGNPAVFRALKEYIGVAVPEAAPVEIRQVGVDHYPLPADSPLAGEHRLVEKLLEEVIKSGEYHAPKLRISETGRQIEAMEHFARGRVLLAAAERDVIHLLRDHNPAEQAPWEWPYAAAGVVPAIAKLPFTLDRSGAYDLLLYIAARMTQWNRGAFDDAVPRLIEQVEAFATERPPGEGERYVLHMLRASLIGGPPLGQSSPMTWRLTQLIGDGASFFLVPGEAWTDQLNPDLSLLPKDKRASWTALLKHVLTATGSRPTGKWLKEGAKLVGPIGADDFAEALLRWFPLVSKGRTMRRTGAYSHDARTGSDIMHEENAIALRGLLWLVPTLKRKSEVVRPVAAVCLSAYRKLPGVGPRAVKVGNAAVYSLSEIATPEAVGQLAMLKVRVKFGTAQKEIEKAFTAAAEALGLPRDQIEEMGVPSYGLEEVGARREQFGEGITAELRVDGRDVNLAWLKEGKPQKSVPASVKANHKDELKELQTAAKDIASMLPAQAERIDQSFLLQKKWDYSTWRERYLDHPLVGTIARRLIWQFTSGSEQRAGIWHDGRIVTVDDEPIEVAADARVELWHPIGRPMDDIISWRTWLERHQVRQPFKQAHREVYLLTDAERRTATYSNRFAAHILRQHQFNALCAARGWRNKLRMLVDDAYPPATRDLPHWALRAEFWIEGIGHEYGQDTNDSGAYLRVATDQVRFYRTGAALNLAHAGGGGYTSAGAGPGTGSVNEPLPLDQIPPLVLSEILRDVDLFVGVASVGNDPTWQDGGPEGRYRTYWHDYSFGELSQTAQTRRAVLEALLPRLTKIRDRCSLSDRFLIVRGDLRTYKIHLGSGNILMEPNDQYLCIVPSRSPAAGASDVFLPFEGDGTLSVILSKTFLLAEDRKINDPTIIRQIGEASFG